jgi:hypothetical protein
MNDFDVIVPGCLEREVACVASDLIFSDIDPSSTRVAVRKVRIPSPPTSGTPSWFRHAILG